MKTYKACTTNYLLNNSFEIKDMYFTWYRVLFSKKVN